MMSLQAAVWLRSSHCNNGSCVEVAHLQDGRIAIRDSKNLHAAPLIVSDEIYQSFIDTLKREV
jgi:hypothetical protein